ncbi:hypothetical protein D3C86_1322460 [compost metagenome]
MAKPAFGQRIHAVRGLAGLENIGNQHRVVEALHDDAVAFHQQIIIFEVLGDFQDSFIFEQVLQARQRLGKGHLPLRHSDAIAEEIAAGAGLVRQRNISGPDIGARGILAVIGNRQRETDKFGLHRIERGRFRIEGDNARLPGRRNPAVERRKIPDR